MGMMSTIYCTPPNVMDRHPRGFSVIGSYGATRCSADGCERPARYRGYCYAHWKQAPPEPQEPQMEEQQAPPEPANDQPEKATTRTTVTDEEFRFVVERAESNMDGARQLGMSDTGLIGRCRRLGIPTPAERQRAAGELATAKPAAVKPAAGRDEFVAMADAMQAIVAALRSLPNAATRVRVLQAVALLEQ